MSHFNLERLANFFIRFSVLGIFFLVPLVFDFVNFLNNNFILPKTIIFLILLGLLFVSTLMRVIVVGKIKFSQRHLKLYLWPALLILTLTLSSYLSINFHHSFFGSYERLNGLNFYLALFLWFILISFNIYQDKKILNLKQVFYSIVLSSTLVGLYALAQFFGLDYINWIESPIGSRAFSTLGQPNYLGLFLLFTWPAIVYLFFTAKENYLKFFLGFAVVINLGALIVSFSRGSWLAFVITNLVFFTYLIRKKGIFKIKKFLIICLFLMALIFIFSFQPIFRDRTSNFFSGATVSTRVLYFQAAFEKILHKPVYGYGLEQQENLFRDNFNKDWTLYEGLNIYMDRVHNIFVDYLIVGGVLALLAFLLWLFQVFRQFILLEKKDKKIKISQFLFMGIFSALIAMQFTFETTTSYIYLWGYASILGAIYIDKNEFFDDKKVYILKISRHFKNIFILVLLFLFFIFFTLQLNRLSADHYFKSGLDQLYRQEYPAAILLYDYALEIKDLNKYHQKFSQNIAYSLIDNNLPVYRELEIKLNKTNLILGDGYKNNLTKGIIYRALKNYPLSEEFYLKARENAPNNFHPYLELAKLYKDEKRYLEAERYYFLALNNLADISDPRLSLPHKSKLVKQITSIYSDLADIQVQQSSYLEAINFLQASYAIDNNVLVLKRIADNYYSLEDYDKAIEYNLRGQEFKPDDPAWPTALASLYHLINNDNLALEQLNIALSIDDSYEPAKALKKVFETR